MTMIEAAAYDRLHELNEQNAQRVLDLEERCDTLRALLRDLIATIELHTDCMSNMIDREALDPYIEQAEQYGINGECDYMRKVAQDALTPNATLTDAAAQAR